MSGWISTQPSAQDAVSVLLAGDPGVVTSWYNALVADGRFRVGSFANDPQDLQLKMANQPEVLVLQARIFPGPPPLVDFLSGAQAAVYVVLPGDVPEDVIGQIRALTPVKGAFRGDVHLPELAGRMYETAQALRQQAPALEGAWRPPRAGGVSGLRIVTVWNTSGGTGKTTVATNLAYEAANRGLKTLLVSLGAPDDTPMILDLQPEPNLARWPNDPSPEGLKALIQRVGDLDVIVGFRNVLEESSAVALQPEQAGSIPSLVMTAAYQSYAVIVVDAPPSTTAPLAIMAANTLVLVARPTAADAQRTLEAVRTVLRHLAGRHRVAPANIFVVLNQGASGDYGPDEWHKLLAVGCKQAGLAAPPVAVAIPDDPAVRTAQNNGKIAMQVSDELARGIHVLADALFGGEVERPRAKAEGRSVRIGGLGIRFKK